MEGNLNQEDGTSQKVAVKTMKCELILIVLGVGSCFSIWCFIRPVMGDGAHMSGPLSSHRGRATIMNCSCPHRMFFSFLTFRLFMYLLLKYCWFMGFPGGASGKETACSAGDKSLIPGMGRSPREGNGNPLQYPCLENPHRQKSLVGSSPWVTESDMPEPLSMHAHSGSPVFQAHSKMTQSHRYIFAYSLHLLRRGKFASPPVLSSHGWPNSKIDTGQIKRRKNINFNSCPGRSHRNGTYKVAKGGSV